MATNYFLGRNRAWLEALRAALQETGPGGQVIRIKTGPGQETEFNPGKTSIIEWINLVQYAISQLPDADPDDPNDANPYLRPGYTTPIFCR